MLGKIVYNKRCRGSLVLAAIIVSFTTIAMLSVSTSVSAATSTGPSEVAVTLKDMVALRILDSTASTEITNLVINVTPTPNGSFAKNSLMVEGSTSNVTGYKLYMTSIGKDHGTSSSEPAYTTALVNTDPAVESSVGTIPTLDLASSGTDIPTITEADFRVRNSLYRNRWGYSLTSLDVTDTTSITYAGVPEQTEQRQIDEKETAVDKGLTPVTIGVNATSGLTSGTYKNTLEFTAIANDVPIDYKLTFNANLDGTGGEEGASSAGLADMPEDLTASSLASTYTFTIPSGISNMPIKTNMVIKEWNTKPDGTGTAYALGDKYTITIDDTDPHSNEATLYAIWTKDFFSIASMQEMYPTVCAKLYTPSNATGANATAITLTSDNAGTVPGAKATQAVTSYAGYKSIVTNSDSVSGDNQPYVAQRTLSDIRDSKKYIIRKMADGNCWMSSNLKYELYANSTRTGVNNTTGEQITFNTGAICGNGNTDAACIMNGNTAYNSTYDSWYYNWYAATAGSGTESMVNQDAPYSICPTHWRLPTNYVNASYPSGGADKSWGYLANTYGINPENHASTTEYQILDTFPFNLPRAGYFSSGAFQNSGSGAWWSFAAYSTAIRAYGLGFHTTYVNPQVSGRKYDGLNVRCVAL